MTPLPDSVRDQVAGDLHARGYRGGIAEVVPVGGGCINNGARVVTGDGSSAFLKWFRMAPEGFFHAEASGLSALRAAVPAPLSAASSVTLRVPEPLALLDDPATTSWLLMEYVEPGAATHVSDRRLGRGLAALHGADVSEDASRCGWKADNWIGTFPQHNQPDDSWGAFWRDRRIVPQLDVARSRGRARDPVFDRLVDRISTALEGVETFSLLHGDLWSGNTFSTTDGSPVLVDPAVYRGDSEVDIAMTELFGGFGEGFHSAYRELSPLTAEYEAYRRELYQLYYLLVHVNLFGRSYEEATIAAARHVVAALG